ncbi:MAG: right-handed parallel beta-helix repeat-containing protein [Bacteroidota bacterium]
MQPSLHCTTHTQDKREARANLAKEEKFASSSFEKRNEHITLFFEEYDIVLFPKEYEICSTMTFPYWLSKLYYNQMNAVSLPIAVLFFLSIIWGCNSKVENHGSTYYVDANQGNDKNDGLGKDRAWKTLDKVNGFKYHPGDSILFRSGSKWDGQLEINCSGTREFPIVFSQYGERHKPGIYGNGEKKYTIRILNSSYTEVNGFEVTNMGDSIQGGRYGVLMHADNEGEIYQSVLRNIDVHSVNGDPIKKNGGGGGIVWKISGEIPSRFVDAVIEGCHVYDCVRNGIVSKSAYAGKKYQGKKEYYSQGMKIRNNLIERIPGDGIIIQGCDSALVEYNTCRDFTDDLPDVDKNAAAGIWPWNSLNTIIQYNEVSGHKASWDGQGFDSDWNCDGTIIQYNYSHDNAGGFILICSNGKSGYNNNTTVRYNISVNDGYRTWGRGENFCPSIHIGGNVRNTRIYNNTIYTRLKPESTDKKFIVARNWGGWADSTFVYNNIFFAADTTDFDMGKSRNNYFSNNFYSANTILPDDISPVTGDPWFANPGFDNKDVLNYKLAHGSPAIGAGKIIKDNGGKDYFGNIVVTDLPPNIGADNSN